MSPGLKFFFKFINGKLDIIYCPKNDPNDVECFNSINAFLEILSKWSLRRNTFFFRSINFFPHIDIWLACSIEVTAAQMLAIVLQWNCVFAVHGEDGARLHRQLDKPLTLSFSSGRVLQWGWEGWGWGVFNWWPKKEARVRAEGGHPARSLSQRPACPQQPSLINPLTGAADSEELQATRGGQEVNQATHRPVTWRRTLELRPVGQLRPQQRVDGAQQRTHHHPLIGQSCEGFQEGTIIWLEGF